MNAFNANGSPRSFMPAPPASFPVRQSSWAASGFTLVELAIALAVVLIGLLALFALVSSGLESSTKATAETQAAIFADSVFNALGSGNLVEAEKGTNTTNESYWRLFWYNLTLPPGNLNKTNLTVAAYEVWQKASVRVGPVFRPAPMPVFADGLVYTNEFLAIPSQASFNTTTFKTNVVHAALRYQLQVALPSPWAVTNVANARVPVTLRVWDGKFGILTNAMVFYAEFDNPGDL